MRWDGVAALRAMRRQTTTQVRWLRTRLSQLAPQALLVG